MTETTADVVYDAHLSGLSEGLAHELANTGNALQLTADLIGVFLAEGNLDKARSAVEQLDASCRRVLGLARSFRAMASVPAPLQPGSHTLYEVLQSAADTGQDEADLPGVHLTLTGSSDLQGQPVKVGCDLAAIRYMLGQLVRNAVDAGARTIRVEAFPDAGQAVIQVRDDGHGIVDPVRKRMFAMFASTRHDQGHAGLGLWYAQCLGRAQRIQLECVGGDPGNTVFELRFDQANLGAAA